MNHKRIKEQFQAVFAAWLRDQYGTDKEADIKALPKEEFRNVYKVMYIARVRHNEVIDRMIKVALKRFPTMQEEIAADKKERLKARI
jgi:hypothetical protein